MSSEFSETFSKGKKIRGKLQREFFSDGSLSLEFMRLASGTCIDLLALDGGFTSLLDGCQRFGLGNFLMLALQAPFLLST